MKKSLLLSSIMALVLVIALSTATFAWYGSSTTATANMATLQASSGDGNLQISNAIDSGWGSSANFSVSNATTPLIPASIKGTAGTDGNPATVNAGDFASYANWFKGSKNANGNTNTVVAMGENDNYVRAYTVYLRNIGTEAIKVNLSGLAFASGAATTEAQAIQNASEQLRTQCAYMILKGNDVVCNSLYHATAAAGNDLTAGLEIAAKAPNATGAIEIPAYVDTNSIVSLTVYNWIDGWLASSDAGTNSQLGKVTFSITFTIYKAPTTPSTGA